MPQAYLNGDWIDDARLAIPVDDLGFALGVTVTERLRTFGGQVFRQAEHVGRMVHSLEIVGMQAAAIAGEIDAAITEFVRRAKSSWQDDEDLAVVAFATPGSGSGPTRCVHGFPLPFHDWAHQYAEGVSLRASRHCQTPPNCWPPELKCRSRMHYYLADQEAQAKEPGARAVLLDQDGYVSETSTANIMLYREGEGVLSPRMDKVLPGVSVAVIRELADELDVPFVESDITLDELKSADEAWLSSTSICMLPVVRCDGRPISEGRPGPAYRKFLAAWSELVGVDIARQARKHALD